MSSAGRLARAAPEAGRLLTYAVVGVVNTAVDFAVFFLLLGVGAPPLVGNATGLAAGAITSYLANGLVTFRGTRGGGRLLSLRRMARFAAVVAVCLTVSSLMMAALLGWGAWRAKVAATLATLILGYVLNRKLVFDAPRSSG